MNMDNYDAVDGVRKASATNEFGMPGMEKGTEYRMGASEGEVFTQEHELKRSLQGRHMQMIAM